MVNKNILISGAGIAGTTLAFWLKKFGFNPTVIEKASHLREGGYAIDFWGAGYEVAKRMELLRDLEKADLNIDEVTFVDKNNKRMGGLDYKKLKKLMNDQAFTFLRSDLSRVIYHHLNEDIEVIFNDSITKIDQKSTGVEVTFRSGRMSTFHLVVGADGLHSITRNLAFGLEMQFEKFYGYYTASFTIGSEIYHDRSFQMYNVPGKQAAVYSINNKVAALFIFTSPQKMLIDPHDVETQKRILRNEFQNEGWKCGDLLSKMDSVDDFYFDVVSQIQMERWSNNRVTLVGDACDCPSLLSGQGSTLAMVGAYILAGELKEANGNYEIAFARYEEIFKPFIVDKQKIARTFAKSFVPKTNFGIWARTAFARLMFLPIFANLFIKQFMYDKLNLKDY